MIADGDAVRTLGGTSESACSRIDLPLWASQNVENDTVKSRTVSSRHNDYREARWPGNILPPNFRKRRPDPVPIDGQPVVKEALRGGRRHRGGSSIGHDGGGGSQRGAAGEQRSSDDAEGPLPHDFGAWFSTSRAGTAQP